MRYNARIYFRLNLLCISQIFKIDFVFVHFIPIFNARINIHLVYKTYITCILQFDWLTILFLYKVQQLWLNVFSVKMLKYFSEKQTKKQKNKKIWQNQKLEWNTTAIFWLHSGLFLLHLLILILILWLEQRNVIIRIKIFFLCFFVRWRFSAYFFFFIFYMKRFSLHTKCALVNTFASHLGLIEEVSNSLLNWQVWYFYYFTSSWWYYQLFKTNFGNFSFNVVHKFDFQVFEMTT